jgi:hypothetical protein
VLDGEFRIDISKEDQEELNKYFKDPELPKHLE